MLSKEKDVGDDEEANSEVKKNNLVMMKKMVTYIFQMKKKNLFLKIDVIKLK